MTTRVVWSSLRSSRTSEYPDKPVPTTTIGAWSVICLLRVSADFDHFEVFLAHTTVRADPVLGHIFPCGTGRNTVLRPAFRFIIDQATHYALPLFHACSPLKHRPT